MGMSRKGDRVGAQKPRLGPTSHLASTSALLSCRRRCLPPAMTRSSSTIQDFLSSWGIRRVGHAPPSCTFWEDPKRPQL